MLALRGRRGFLMKKKFKSMDPIFFAFCTDRGPLSLNIFLEKNIRFAHPYKKFVSEITDYLCFRADMDPKTKIFGLHVKFPKKKGCKKKLFFLTNIHEKRQTIFSISIFGHIYEDK